MSFGERLKEARERKHYTYAVLANKMDVAQQMVKAWGVGLYEPRITNVRNMAKALSVSTDWLLEMDSEKKS